MATMKTDAIERIRTKRLQFRGKMNVSSVNSGIMEKELL